MNAWKEWSDLKSGPRTDELPREQAWHMLTRWKAAAQPVGVLFVSQLSSFHTFATLSSARNGTIQLTTESASATFNLKEATFTYGPMQTWPRWPNLPIVEVMALNAYLPQGTWLCIAEGLKRKALPPRMLPTL